MGAMLAKIEEGCKRGTPHRIKARPQRSSYAKLGISFGKILNIYCLAFIVVALKNMKAYSSVRSVHYVSDDHF